MMKRLTKPFRTPNHFRIQYASNLFVDCHTQHFEGLLKPAENTEALALLGNIGRPAHGYTRSFLNYCASNWQRVFWILGPHELSNRANETHPHYVHADSAIELAASLGSNIHVMNQHEIRLYPENVALVGSTLWTSNQNKIPQQPEFTSIHGRPGVPLSPSVYADWNKEDCDFLHMKGSFWDGTSPDTRLIFLTHHLPSPLLLNRSLSTETYKRAALDVNSLDFKIRPAITAWLSGATGSCSSGMFGLDPTKQTFCAVNSCFEYPYNTGSKPNPGYYNQMIMDIDTHDRKNPPDAGLPKGKRLPPLVSGIFKPLLSLK